MAGHSLAVPIGDHGDGRHWAGGRAQRNGMIDLAPCVRLLPIDYYYFHLGALDRPANLATWLRDLGRPGRNCGLRTTAPLGPSRVFILIVAQPKSGARTHKGAQVWPAPDLRVRRGLAARFRGKSCRRDLTKAPAASGTEIYPSGRAGAHLWPRRSWQIVVGVETRARARPPACAHLHDF